MFLNAAWRLVLGGQVSFITHYSNNAIELDSTVNQL